MKSFDVTFTEPNGHPTTVRVEAWNLIDAIQEAGRQLREAFPTVYFHDESAKLVK